jgi:hypothetical protein
MNKAPPLPAPTAADLAKLKKIKTDEKTITKVRVCCAGSVAFERRPD